MKSDTIFLCILLMLMSFSGCDTKKDWGSVSVGKDQNGRWMATLENELIRCRYSWKPFKNEDKGGETNISELLIKSIHQNQAAVHNDSGLGRIDACAGRYAMIEATIHHDSDDFKSIQLKWNHKTEGKICKQIVSIYPNSPVLKIDYLDYGVNVVDIANPGEHENSTYWFYGAEKWKRDYLLYPKGYYYPANDQHVVTETGMPGDDGPGPLNYNGFFIMAVFNVKTGVGYGRVAPVEAISIIKLLNKKGFELFPYWRQEKVPYTSYLYTITGGSEEALDIGKKIADRNVR